jgi:hypothetical protein
MSEIVEEREHTEPSAECWCHPDLVLEGDGDKFGSVWVHKAPAEELAPAWIIVEAIADAFKSDDE